MDPDEETLKKALKKALKTGADYADVIFQSRKSREIRFEDGRVDDISSGVDQGVGVRVIRGELVTYAYTEATDLEHVLAAAASASEALRHHGTEVPLEATPAPDFFPTVKSPSSGYQKPAEIIERLKACDDVARSSGKEIKQVTAVHSDVREITLIVNSLGESRTDEIMRTRFIIQVVASRDGMNQTGMERAGSLAGQEFYLNNDVLSMAEAAARQALVMLDAAQAPAGRMPVVLGAGTGGVLLHEACGHGLELDHILKGASVFSGKTGEKVASDVVTVVDDPSLFGLWGSYSFDDEGFPASETVLIENGYLKAFLSGRHEAMKTAGSSTGNGRRQSYKHMPIPRMSNTFLREGGATAEEIIKDTDSGLFAKKLGGGQVDPVTGDYVFSVMEGYTIERGEIARPVKGAVLIGNGPRTLKLIDAVGNNLLFESGTCGKDGQSVPVTTGCPTFRIGELTVGGTQV